jgi:uncharacterized membrane protein YgcG
MGKLAGGSRPGRRPAAPPSAPAAPQAPAAPKTPEAPQAPDAPKTPDAPQAPLVDEIVIADARRPVPLAEAVAGAGGPADVTVVCVDVAGCEGGAILSTAQGGTVIFFSMATSFSAAALGAEGVAADVTMLIGTGYTPGHAGLALNLIRTNKAVRALFTHRLGEDGAPAPGRPALSSPDECDIQPAIGGSMPHSSGRGGGEASGRGGGEGSGRGGGEASGRGAGEGEQTCQGS